LSPGTGGMIRNPVTPKSAFLKNYGFSILLLFSISVGSALGIFLKDKAVIFKPFGDIFLNLMFTAVVPLVFFSISSAVAEMADVKRLGKILFAMILVFIATGTVASFLMMAGVRCFPPAQGIQIALNQSTGVEHLKVSEAIVSAFTVSDFPDLFSKKNMLALIIFSLLLGLATSFAGQRGKAFAGFLSSGNDVMMKAISLIMLYAPVGLGAYFAYLVGIFGPQLLGSYLRAMALYYPLSILYFFIGFTAYAYLAGRIHAVKSFWANIIPAALTSLATSSSVATIPVNLEAARKIGVPKDIREVVIPIGATIHMDGSCLAAVLKIALLFGLFKMDFTGAGTILTAVGIALLSGTVMAGIPGGGFIGEILIVSLYGFPMEALPIISMVGTLVDPPATMINATGDNVCSMMLARILGGKKWMTTHSEPA